MTAARMLSTLTVTRLLVDEELTRNVKHLLMAQKPELPF